MISIEDALLQAASVSDAWSISAANRFAVDLAGHRLAEIDGDASAASSGSALWKADRQVFWWSVQVKKSNSPLRTPARKASHSVRV